MIIFDTNIISEAGKRKPNERVAQWFDLLPTHKTFITAVTAGEMWWGIEQLPAGERKRRLAADLEGMIHGQFRR